MDAICRALRCRRPAWSTDKPTRITMAWTRPSSVTGTPRPRAVAGARVAVAVDHMEHHRGGPPADGRRRRDPVHAGARRHDGRLRRPARERRARSRRRARPARLPLRSSRTHVGASSLAVVRKGEYEGLREAVARGERLPDFGPHAIGPAGATAVGARKPLVAFNLYLSGTDEAAAKAIAAEVRESSGGLPALRAIGFWVPERRCLTVSMNLIDHEVTGLVAATTRSPPRRRARSGRARLRDRGLVPEAALGPGDTEHVGSRDSIRPGASSSSGWQGRRGRRSTPTGQRALGRVAARRSPRTRRRRRGGASRRSARRGRGAGGDGRASDGRQAGVRRAEARMTRIVEESDRERTDLLGLADRDAEAFEEVMAAYKLPKATAEDAGRTLQRCRRPGARRGHPARGRAPLRLPDGPRRGGHDDREPERGLGRAERGHVAARGGVARPRERATSTRSPSSTRPAQRSSSTRANSAAPPCTVDPARCERGVPIALHAWAGRGLRSRPARAGSSRADRRDRLRLP